MHNLLFQDHIKYKFIRLAGISLLALFFCFQSHGQNAGLNRKKLEEKRKNLQIQINLNKKALQKTKAEESNSIIQLKVISKQINTREQIIDNIEQQTFELSLEIADQRRTIETLQNDLRSLKMDYAQNIISAYKKRNINETMLFIFDAKNFNQAYKRIRYLGQYGGYRQKQAKLILNTQQSIINEINKMIDIKSRKMFMIGEKVKEKSELMNDKKEETVLLGKLQQKYNDIKKQIIEQEKIAKRLNKTIEDLIAKEISEAREAEEKRYKATAKNKKTTKDNRTSNSYLSEVDMKLSDDFASIKGKLPWPVESGKITESFGEHAHPTLPGIYKNNFGVDISTQPNSPVHNVFKGKVKGIFAIPGMENVVMVCHGEYFTVYARLVSVNVKMGQQIEARDIVGTVATNSEDASTRLHFEIYKQRILQNPQVWLKQYP